VPPSGGAEADGYARGFARTGSATHACVQGRENRGCRKSAPDDVLGFTVMAAAIAFSITCGGAGFAGLSVNRRAVRTAKYSHSDFHIGGSDASGIVYATGPRTSHVKVGDRVVILRCLGSPFAGGQRRRSDVRSVVQNWGYETKGQFRAVLSRCRRISACPRASHLTWEEAAGPTLVGATAYRMLMGWSPHVVRHRRRGADLGRVGRPWMHGDSDCQGRGGIPVGIGRRRSQNDFCMKPAPRGCINRKKYLHWGMMPIGRKPPRTTKWPRMRAFASDLGHRRRREKSAHRVQHPGEDTIPTSVFVCDTRDGS